MDNTPKVGFYRPLPSDEYDDIKSGLPGKRPETHARTDDVAERLGGVGRMRLVVDAEALHRLGIIEAESHRKPVFPE